MNPQEFDDKIRNSLESLDIKYDPETWTAFEKKMDSSKENSSTVFDATVRDLLDGVEIPMDAGLWNRMALQLDRSTAIRRVRFVKLAEAAVILLLALQVISFDDAASEQVNPGVQSPKPVAIPMAGSVDVNRFSAGNLQKKPKQTVSIASVQTAENDDDPDTLLVVSAPDKETAIATQPLPVVTSLLTAWQRELPDINLTASENAHPGRSRKWFLAAFSEAVASVVRDDASNSFTSMTPGFGVIMGRASSRWGLETGVMINRISYAPDSRTTVYAGNPQTGFLAAYTSRVEGTTVSVPVRVSRRIAESGAFDLRALAGLTAELVAEKDYSRRTVYLPPAGQSTGGTDLPTGTIPDKNQRGVFEGGNLTNNLTANATFGLRFSARLPNHYHIFIEPAASFNLAGGWGPDKELLDRYSIRAGIYARL